MKVLGHAYIATHAVDGNNQQLITGSLLPEMLPYIPNEVFDYHELHEGGKKLFEYLNRFYPEKKDLALGLLSHGVEVGADKFSRASERLLISKRKLLLPKIAQAQKVKLEVAKIRLHNYAGLGLDWLLVQSEPKLVKQVQKALKKVNIEEISYLLAEAFLKNKASVKVMVKTLFVDIYHCEDLTSAAGLARIWARQARGLPEKDRVDVSKSAALIKECGKIMEDEWEGFLDKVCFEVRRSLEFFVRGRK